MKPSNRNHHPGSPGEWVATALALAIIAVIVMSVVKLGMLWF